MNRNLHPGRFWRVFAYSLLIAVIFYVPALTYAGPASIYKQGITAAKSGSLDLAFMYFKTLVDSYPESAYYTEALFAMGEYYFSISGYSRAADMFSRCIEAGEEDEADPFALAYLLNIAKKKEKQELAELIKNKIISLKQVTLLFRDYKEISYFSPLQKGYRALFYIDRIEFYVNEKLFGEFSY